MSGAFRSTKPAAAPYINTAARAASLQSVASQSMSRQVASPQSAPASTPQANKRAMLTSSPLTARVIEALEAGVPRSVIVIQLRISSDLLAMIEQYALDTHQLQRRAIQPVRCGSIGCNPDPQSLVCAGCPIMPLALRRARKRRSKCEQLITVFTRLIRKFL